jgi:hypothetical protein
MMPLNDYNSPTSSAVVHFVHHFTILRCLDVVTVHLLAVRCIHAQTPSSNTCYYIDCLLCVKTSYVNSRLRFMLRDLIELREHNWVPRRDEEKAKTIAQIHEQVAREEVVHHNHFDIYTHNILARSHL